MMRKMILGTASVLALGIGGAALDYVADADDAIQIEEGNMPSQPETSQHWINAANLSKDDVRWHKSSFTLWASTMIRSTA